MLNKGLFQNNSNNWGTPQDLFDELDEEFNFDLDVCASKENFKCIRYFTKEDNALLKNWNEECYNSYTCFMNPPYDRIQDKFVKKAKEESNKGVTVVCLLPARTDTKRFHEYIWDENLNEPRERVEIRFIKGRLKFEGFDDKKGCKYFNNTAPFPSMVVVFYPKGKNK